MPITELQKASNNNLLIRDLKRKPCWRGDHSGCAIGHRDRLCSSLNAWVLNGDAKIVPSIAERPTNKRFHSQVKYSNADGREPEPAWKAKGWREAEEIEGVRPIPEVVEKMRERGVEELERGMQFKKFEYASIERAKADWIAKFDRANAADPAAPASSEGDPDGAGGSGGFVGENPPKKGRARG